MSLERLESSRLVSKLVRRKRLWLGVVKGLRLERKWIWILKMRMRSEKRVEAMDLSVGGGLTCMDGTFGSW